MDDTFYNTTFGMILYDITDDTFYDTIVSFSFCDSHNHQRWFRFKKNTATLLLDKKLFTTVSFHHILFLYNF